MSELDVKLAGKSLADFTNTQLRLALGAVLYTNTADMWKRYLNQLGYSGDVSQMLQKYYVEYSVPQNFRNYINAGAFIYSPQQLFTDGSKGLFFDNNDFVEPTSWRRNLLTYSEQFDNATGWPTLTNVVVTGNQIASPDGAVTADLIVDTVTNAQHRLFRSVSADSSQKTWSVYAKAGTASWVQLNCFDGTSAFAANFDLSSGVVGWSYAGSGSISTSITSVGSGWYRCSMTPSTVFATGNIQIALTGNVNNTSVNPTYAGTGTGVYIWGGQFESAATASTYQRITDFNSDFLAAFPSTTLYLDSAGTTAATVNGLVGLQLDKSANLAVGAELVPSGNYTGTVDGGFSFSGRTIIRSGTAVNGALLDLSTAVVNGAFYRITMDVTGITGDTLVVRVGNTGGATFHSITANGSYSFLAQATLTNARLQVSGLAGTTGTATISNISVKAIAGNHRYQTTTGSKPVLRGTPTGSNLVTNGDFASGTGWTVNSGWAIGSGTLNATAVTIGTGKAVFAGATITAGRVYRITYTITSFTAGGISVTLGSGSYTDGTFRGAVGTYVEYITAGFSGGVEFIRRGGDFTGSIDNVEVVDVSAGSVTAPYGLQYDGVDDFLQTAAVDFATVTSDGLARRNLLTFPSAFDDAVWTQDNVSVSANADSAPNSTTTADKIIPSAVSTFHRIRIIGGGTGQFTFSAYVKASGYNFVKLRLAANWVNFNLSAGTIGLSSGDAGSIQDVGGGWYRCSVSANLASANTAFIYPMPTNDAATDPTFTGDGTSGVLAWGAQVEAGSTPSAFQDIGTDKMFVCVGIQRGITTSLNMVVESSTGGGAGSFYIAAPYNATSEVAFVLNGTATGGYSVDNLSTTAPPREVYSTQYDIGAALLADEIKPRINGAIPTLTVLAAGPAGTGNFGNHAIYFGRRAGTSFPLNGLEYGMVICGKTLASTQISQTERYIAQRTGISL